MGKRQSVDRYSRDSKDFWAFFTFGNSQTALPESTYFFSRWLFLRMLGVIYGIAFITLSVQVVGLIGSNGILPVEKFLEIVQEETGWGHFLALPTLFWFGINDSFLKLVCYGGIVLSMALILGWASRYVLLLLWILYLSLVNGGQDFLSFQWDILLLEMGFLAIFFAPSGFSRKRAWQMMPSAIIHFLFCWLLFRVLFSAGLVKILSGDPLWKDLTALQYHYQTQPLPVPLAWYFHQLPLIFHRFSTACVFFLELAVPFLIFMPKVFKRYAGGLIIFHQVFIMATGNYGFLNFLVIALALLLFDDQLLSEAVRSQRLTHVIEKGKGWWTQVFIPWGSRVLAVFLIVLSLIAFLETPGIHRMLWDPVKRIYETVMPWRIVNAYGIFPVMVDRRLEISVEGSNNGEVWRPYQFKYKVDDVKKIPPCLIPYLPRLDWHMWIAAQGHYKQNPWLINFAVRLLQGSQDVYRLIKTKPFEWPPRYIRFVLYEYRFTSMEEKKESGNKWIRNRVGLYSPVISLPEQPE